MPTPEYQGEIKKSPELELESEIEELNLPRVSLEKVKEEISRVRDEELSLGGANFADSASVFDINKITDEYTVLYTFLKVAPDDLTQKHFDLFRKSQLKIKTKLDLMRTDDVEYRTVYDYIGWVANKFTEIYYREYTRRSKQGRSM